MGEVEETIRHEIRRNGVIPVARFIELALYHPEGGYYRGRRDPFGKMGDFYTAGQLQPVFGELLASYVTQLERSTGDELPFSVLELGAGRKEMRRALSKWNYRGFDWTGDALPPAMRGLILANEFFDALPVQLLEKGQGQWRELGVALSGDRFTLSVIGPACELLNEYALRFGTAIPEGGRIEVNLEAAAWFQRLAKLQVSGRLLIIDYGYSAHELARFPQGTLMTFRQHRTSTDFLSHPGERDITAHVNFSYLQQLAEETGYEVESISGLSGWMTRVWNENQLRSLWNERDQRWKLQWKHLFFGMGETFRVLELRRRSMEDILAVKEKAPGV